MATLGNGQIGNVNVPKKAIAAMDVIYQTSALMSVMERAGIPSMNTKETQVIWDVTKGVAGEDRVEIDADVDKKRVKYNQIKADILWSNYSYDVLEGAKLNTRDPDAIWDDSMTSAAEFFAAIRDYRSISAILGAAMNTAAATTTWGSAGADPEADIIAGVSKIMEKSNMRDGEKISVVVPAKVFFEVNKLTLINNIQRTVKDYLEKSFTLEIHPFRPMVNDAGTALYDGLSTSALMFVQGKKTGINFTYDRAEAARRRIPLVEHERMFGRGDRFVQKMGTVTLPMWDAVGTYTSSTDYKNNRIYTITGVTS